MSSSTADAAPAPKKPRWHLNWKVALAASIFIVFVLWRIFGPPLTSPVQESKTVATAVQQPAQQQSALLCNAPNQMPEWTDKQIPGSETQWENATAVKIQPCATIRWRQDPVKAGFEVQCHDLDSGKWLPYALDACKATDVVRFKNGSAEGRTIQVRFQP